MPKRIFFSVGEPSGDQHAARLIKAIQQTDPTIQLRGFGGPAMRAAGCCMDRDLTEHAVVGILEVLPKLRDFFRFADQAEDVFRSGDVDAVVLVDFPGFNWHIAKRAKRYRIPVYYYCPPQLWAWGRWRVAKLRRLVDHVLAVLPLERDFFAAHGVETTYVGHPFFDAVHEMKLDTQLLSRLTKLTDSGAPLIAVLPGSRTHEVEQNWPLMLAAIRRLHQLHPRAVFLVAAYRDRQCLWCRNQLDEHDRKLPIEFYVGRTSEVIEASRCAMMVSGSVSLELLGRERPAVVVYRVGRVLNAIGRLLVGVDSITLPNLLSGRKVFPEMVSVGNSQPAIEFLIESVSAMLWDEYYYGRLREQLRVLRQQVAQPGASQAAATWLTATLAKLPDSSRHPRRSVPVGANDSDTKPAHQGRRAA